MNEFDQAWLDLHNFLEGKGNYNPIKTVESIRLDLSNCLKLIPPPLSPFFSFPMPKDDAFIFLKPDEVLGVQQFVTKFGCHLIYQTTSFDKPQQYFAYTIGKN